MKVCAQWQQSQIYKILAWQEGYTLGRLTQLSKKKEKRKVDPTQGFNIKTNFPKMENKNKQKQSTKIKSHI